MLQLGSVGNSVADAKNKLSTIGYQMAKGAMTGAAKSLFDVALETAVKKFQADQKITKNVGKIDQRTSKRIDTAYQKATASGSKTTSILTTSGTQIAKAVQNSVNVAAAKMTQSSSTAMSTKSKMLPENIFTIANITFSPSRIISFCQLMPEDISVSHVANFEPVSVMGRSNEFQTFSGGSGRSFTFSITVHEDYLRWEKSGSKITDLEEFLSQIEALTFPRFKDGAVVPPRLYIRGGDFIKMRAVCSNCTITRKGPIRVDPKTNKTKRVMAEISLDLTEILSQSFSADEFVSFSNGISDAYARYQRWCE